jgi:catechol 2,3-dioxygenase-like lactoylglutathione lyase family enzyme
LRIFVDHLEDALDFYTQTMGLKITEEVSIHNHRCVFLRANTEHHSIALYPAALAKVLQLPNPSSLLSFAMQVGSYQQLQDAIAHLKSNGVQFLELPREISAGIGHHAFAIDPDGFLIELYWEMEQIGWDGQPRPAHLRPKLSSNPADWPSAIELSADAYCGEVFLGPLN